MSKAAWLTLPVLLSACGSSAERLKGPHRHPGPPQRRDEQIQVYGARSHTDTRLINCASLHHSATVTLNSPSGHTSSLFSSPHDSPSIVTIRRC